MADNPSSEDEDDRDEEQNLWQMETVAGITYWFTVSLYPMGVRLSGLYNPASTILTQFLLVLPFVDFDYDGASAMF
jgi:hypothetical protein